MKKFVLLALVVCVVMGMAAGLRTGFAAKEEAKGTALCLSATFAAADSYEYCYLNFIEKEDEFSIPKGAFLEYDMFISKTSAGFSGGVDFGGGSLGTLRDNGGEAGCKDQDGNSPHPAGSAENANGAWWHRKIDLGPIAGESFMDAILAVDAGKDHKAGVYKAYYKNIQITDGKGKILVDLFTNKDKVPIGDVTEHAVKDMSDYSLTVVPLSAVK